MTNSDGSTGHIRREATRDRRLISDLPHHDQPFSFTTTINGGASNSRAKSSVGFKTSERGVRKETGRRVKLRGGNELNLVWKMLVMKLLVLLIITLAMVPYLGEQLGSASVHSQGLRSRGAENSWGDVDTSLPLIHIVNTRFMQEQAHLIHLADARMELFETFCLPTMTKQTIQPNPHTVSPRTTPYRFLWIIKTDPNLNQTVRDRMVELLRPHGNFFLVGSNNNFGIGVRTGSWRGGEAGADILNAETGIYTGNMKLLQWAHDNRADKIVVETRLDADDGLPSGFLELVQMKALKHLRPDDGTRLQVASGLAAEVVARRRRRLAGDEQAGDEEDETEEEDETDDEESSDDRATWMFWCMSQSVNWYPSLSSLVELDGNTTNATAVLQKQDPGTLEVDVNNGKVVCLTPGLTLGLSVGEVDTSVPRYSHYDMLHELALKTGAGEKGACGMELPIRCVQLVNMRAVRSRTPTSAGMKGLTAKEAELTADDIQQRWNFMRDVFSVTKERAMVTNQHLTDNAIKIMQDNLKGQCTKGHSCKHNSKVILREMLEKVGGKEAVPPEKKKWKKKTNTDGKTK